MNQAVTNSTTRNDFDRHDDYDEGTYERRGQLQPVDDFLDYAVTYARQNPGTTAMWCFGIGFIVGWRLKPW